MNWTCHLCPFNSLRLRQNRRHFADNIFKCNFLNENVWIPIEISLKFVPKGPINNIPALVHIMAWRQTGDKPLSEPMMTQFNDAYMRHTASVNSSMILSPIELTWFSLYFKFNEIIFFTVTPCIIGSWWCPVKPETRTLGSDMNK